VAFVAGEVMPTGSSCDDVVVVVVRDFFVFFFCSSATPIDNSFALLYPLILRLFSFFTMLVSVPMPMPDSDDDVLLMVPNREIKTNKRIPHPIINIPMSDLGTVDR